MNSESMPGGTVHAETRRKRELCLWVRLLVHGDQLPVVEVRDFASSTARRGRGASWMPRRSAPALRRCVAKE